MNTFDIVIGGILLFGFIRGLLKGLFVEISSLVAIFLGVYGAIYFSSFVSDFLKYIVTWSDSVMKLVSFCITFGIILLGVGLLGKLFTKIADFAHLGLLNKILGGVFGSLKYSLILSVIFIFFGKMNDSVSFINQESLNVSILYNPIRKVASIVFPSVIKND